LAFFDYCNARFESWMCARLFRWYQALGEDPQLQLIQRNVERECRRNDVKDGIWQEFLMEIADLVLPRDQVADEAHRLWEARGRSDGSDWEDWFQAELKLQRSAFLDPVRVVDTAMAKRRKQFLLPGKEIPASTDSLYRYMRLGDFATNNLKQFSIPVEAGYPSANLDDCADMIKSGFVTGKDTEMSVIGRPDYPVWCTDGSLSVEDDADRVRNTLGLKHIEGGHIVELSYPRAWLAAAGHIVCAPTVPDASATGAANWIFVKNRGMGGPDWGYTAQMCNDGMCRRGAPEAVHPAIFVPLGAGIQIGIRVLGPIKNLCPPVDYEATLKNSDL